MLVVFCWCLQIYASSFIYASLLQENVMLPTTKYSSVGDRPSGKGRDHPVPTSGYYAVNPPVSLTTSIGVLMFIPWWGRTWLYTYTASSMRLLTCSKLSSSQSNSQPFLMVLFILSANALCKGSPHCVILMLIWCSLSLSTYLFEQYWTPRSEWWIRVLMIYVIASHRMYCHLQSFPRAPPSQEFCKAHIPRWHDLTHR